MKEKLLNLILGSLFSSTMWFGSSVALAQWLQNNTEMIIGLFGGEYGEIVGYVLAIIIYALRLITSNSIPEKAELLKAKMKG